MAEFVVMWERSAGNESVGSMWTETAIFPETATLGEIVAWTWDRSMKAPDTPDTRAHIWDGRLMIQIAQRPMEDQP